MKWLRVCSSGLAIPAFVLFLPVLCGAAAAQDVTVGEVAVTVSDAGGSLLPGAEVFLKSVTTTVASTRGGVPRTQISAGEGSCVFLAVPPGMYRLQVRAGGFAPAEQIVTVAGSRIQLAVALVPAFTARVDVSASDAAEDAAAPAHVAITAEEIEHMPGGSVSAPFSSLITMTAPGVSADSNGSFHPLGDHAEASFYLDGQPITDQQSRVFSSQVSLNTLQSIDVREGAPGADVGDKTSMIIVAQTRSGLDSGRPHGAVEFGRGSFATSTGSARLAAGTRLFGFFAAADAVNSARFLDTPETKNLHSNGNTENMFQRLDYRLTDRTVAQLNAAFSHSWFQTPNTYDQQALGQNQRQTITSFNVAPQVTHTVSDHAFSQTNAWLRQDKVRYRPSSDIYRDTPAYLEQARRLTNVGLRTQFTYVRGRHNVAAGGEYKHTLLAEQFATALTDAAYNSPCLNPDGAPSADRSLRNVAQCPGVGLTANPGYLPGLLPFDLTRGGTAFAYKGRTDIKQTAFFAQDVIGLGGLQLKLGLRYDRYNGLVRTGGVQPRVGITRYQAALRTTFRAHYSRVFLTPYNENLIVASSDGPGSPSASLGAAASSVLTTATRNQFNVGFTTLLNRFSISSEYLWKFTDGAYDFDVLLNSPLTFPTQFRKSKIDGGLLRFTLLPVRGLAGFVTVSHTRSRLFGPQTGGVSFSAPYSDVVRPDHDEGLAMNANVRYQVGRRGPWVDASYRYDGGLVSVATPDAATVLQLSGDEQQQMGLYCGSQSATLSTPLRACNGTVGATRIRIPAPGTYDADRNPARIAVRNTVDLAVGEDHLLTHEKRSLGLRVECVNLNNTTALYNYLSTFSGTHFLTPRSVTVRLRYQF